MSNYKLIDETSGESYRDQRDAEMPQSQSLNLTREQATSAILICKAVAGAIRELGEVPNGVLYAHLCGRFDFPTYERIIETILRTGLVRKQGDLLQWIGPKAEF